MGRIVTVALPPNAGPAVIPIELGMAAARTGRICAYAPQNRISQQPSMGALVDQVVANPAVGAQWQWVVPVGGVRLIVAKALFTTSIQAANRFAGLEVLDAEGNVRFTYRFTTAIPASSSVVVEGATNFINGGAISSASGVATIPFPAMTLPEGWAIRSTVAGMQTEDHWGEISILAEKVVSTSERGNIFVLEGTPSLLQAENEVNKEGVINVLIAVPQNERIDRPLDVNTDQATVYFDGRNETGGPQVVVIEVY